MPTVLITGASRGFGLLLAELYADDGWHVIACCRNPENANALQDVASRAGDKIAIHKLDVTNFSQAEDLAQSLEGVAIDVLLNNAGIYGKRPIFEGGMEDQSFGQTDPEEWLEVYRVNVIAPMKVAEAFITHVEASEQKKIVTLTSIVGSQTLNTFGAMIAYRASKAAANSVMKSISVDLAQRGVIAFPLHPGYARTDMGGPGAEIEPIEGATGIRKVIAEATLETAGHFMSYDGSELPW